MGDCRPARPNPANTGTSTVNDHIRMNLTEAAGVLRRSDLAGPRSF